MSLLAVLLLAGSLQVCGVNSQGDPVTIPTYTVDQLQPEYDRLIRRREGQRLLELRAAEQAAAPAVAELGPPPPPAAAPRIVWRPTVERWRGLVDLYFTGQGESQRALATIRCESGGNPELITPPYAASGLFQHLAGYWPQRSRAAGWGGASVLDPEANIAVAAWLVHTDGWSHWDACNRWVCAQGVC